MRICIAGKNDIASSALDLVVAQFRGHDILALPNDDDDGRDTWTRSLRATAERAGVPVVSAIGDLYDFQELLFVSLEHNKIIPVDRFASRRLFNIHFSLLPAYKGAYTSVWPILNGDRTSGVTLHVIDRGIDTGDIIDQIAFPLTEDMTCRDLYLEYNEQGFELFKRNIHRLVSGTGYEAIPQAAANSTYHSRTSIDYGSLAIDLRKTACEIDRQVRAFYFPEYQVPRIHGYPIRQVAVLDRRSTKRPSTVLVDAEQYLEIATIDCDARLFKEE